MREPEDHDDRHDTDDAGATSAPAENAAGDARPESDDEFGWPEFEDPTTSSADVDDEPGGDPEAEQRSTPSDQPDGDSGQQRRETSAARRGQDR